MGFLDKLRGKKDQVVEEIKEHTAEETRNEQAPSEKRYTSEGKPVYK